MTERENSNQPGAGSAGQVDEQQTFKIIGVDFGPFANHALNFLLFPLLSCVFLTFIGIVLAFFSLGSKFSAHHAILVLMFALFGVVIGLLTGASREPVVKVVGPAIFTFLSGFTVYLSGKDSPQPEFVLALPPSLVAMLLAFILNATFASLQRRQAEAYEAKQDLLRVYEKEVELPLEKEARLRALRQADVAREDAVLRMKEVDLPVEKAVRFKELGLAPPGDKK